MVPAAPASARTRARSVVWLSSLSKDNPVGLWVMPLPVEVACGSES